MSKLWVVFVLCLTILSCGVSAPPTTQSMGQVQQALVTCPTPAQLATDIAAASQGAVISLSGVDPLTCPVVPMTQTWSGGSLVFSDSPETVPSKGILYQDTFPATSGTTYNRLWVYHVNGTSGKTKLTVLIKNTGSSAGTLTIHQKGVAGPSSAYVTVGKLAFERWLQSTAGSGVNVNAGQTVVLDSALAASNIVNGNLMHGIYDISMTQSYQATVCMYGSNENPLTVCPTDTVLPRDGLHQRGTFPNADKIYNSSATIDTAAGIQVFELNSSSTTDSDAVGTDATDGSQQTLKGNIGVVYRVHLNASASDGQDLGFLLNPRGGYWGTAVNVMPGLLTGGIFLVPASTEGFSDNTMAGVQGDYAPGTGGDSPWMQWMMTGGSNAPVMFVAVPH